MIHGGKGDRRGFNKEKAGRQVFSVEESSDQPSGPAIEDAYRVLAEELIRRLKDSNRGCGAALHGGTCPPSQA